MDSPWLGGRVGDVGAALEDAVVVDEGDDAGFCVVASFLSHETFADFSRSLF